MNKETDEIADDVHDGNAKERVEQIQQGWKEKGAEFVGSKVWLSVRLQNKVRLKDIRNAIINNPVVPNEWAPEMVNERSIYNNVVTSLERDGLDKFKKYADEIPFDEDSHSGYMSHRMRLEKDNPVPRIDKVFRAINDVREVIDEKTGEVADTKIDDVKVDEGIRVWIERTNHAEVGPEGDETGDSEWDINVLTEQGSNDIPDDYMPFIQTLRRMFEEKRAQMYDSSQVRDLILNNMLLDEERLDAVNVAQGRGLYFVPDTDVEKLEALRDLFQNLDPGIELNLTHIPFFPDADTPEEEALNNNFEVVKDGVLKSLQKEVNELKEEIAEFHNSDKDTRDSTFVKREKRLYELKKRLKDYENKQMFKLEIVEDDLRDMEDMIEENLYADEEAE